MGSLGLLVNGLDYIFCVYIRDTIEITVVCNDDNLIDRIHYLFSNRSICEIRSECRFLPETRRFSLLPGVR